MPFAALSMFHVASVLFATAAGIAAFRLMPDAGIEKAAFVGVCVLLLGVLLAEGAARRMERSHLLQRIDEERRERILQSRVIEALNERISEIGAGAPDEALVAEMRLVRSQLARLALPSRRAPELPPAAVPSASAAPAPRSVADQRLTGEPLLAATTEALKENRIDLYLQPVVRLPQRRTIFHECLTRLRDREGRIITPDQYLPIAEDAGMTTAIDNLSLFRCIQTLKARRGPDFADIAFFCNLSPATLGDVEFFDQFTEFLSGNREMAERLVFEVEARHLLSAEGEAQSHLDTLRTMGFRLSVDHVDTLDLDMAELIRRGAHFIKVDCDPLLSQGTGSAGDVRAMLSSSSVTLIASKVETEDQVVELVESDIRLAQGYLFGEPRPMRDDV
ncbi:MAG: EAL domain-containing protein [Minwuia sp.]|uniref:EAL domain-containing protein n=1 Tax=Minwuia sp. TaxID=2493630 RepID=UPI003A8A8E6D